MNPRRLAVCSWSLKPQSCDQLIERLRDCRLAAVQLHLDPIAEARPGWENAAEKLAAAQIAVLSGMVACVGEDYSTIARIEETGGVVPDATWPATRQRMELAAPVAAAMRLPLVTFHAGFIPDDAANPVRRKVAARITELAELFGAHGVALGLETGQEQAATLRDFLGELRTATVGVNFDPANMLLYGSGDPVAALHALADHVRQVHIKDALPSGAPGQWGRETPVGEGAVDWPAFLAALKEINYTGPLVIEREAGEHRAPDIRRAAERLAPMLPPNAAGV